MILSSLRHTQNGPHVLFVQMEIMRASVSSAAIARRAAWNRNSVSGRCNVKNLPDYVLVFGCWPSATIYAQVLTFCCHVGYVRGKLDVFDKSTIASRRLHSGIQCNP